MNMYNNDNRSGNFIIDRLLRDINEKLHSNKLKIISERSEIKKAEILLSYFNKSLEQQNNELNILSENEDQLEDEISKFFGYQYAGESNIGQLNANIRISTDEIITSDQVLLTRKCSVIQNNGWDDKIDLTAYDSSNEKGDTTVLKRKLPKKDIILKQYELSNVENVTVYSILSRNEYGVFVGGSKGFLARYYSNGEHAYDIDTEDDIIQIEIMIQCKIAVLVAFTKSNIFIFNNLADNEPYKEIHLEGMTSIFNEGTILYITLDNGITKKINKTNWIVCDYLDNKYSKDCVLFPSTIYSRYFLVTLKDKLLYKTKNKDLSVLQLIPGITDVKKVIKMKTVCTICYSDSIIWILNRTFDILDCIPFKNGVKLVEGDKEHRVVVDYKNIIHIYDILIDGDFGDKILEKQMAGEVTAIFLENETIYVSVCNAMFSFDFLE